MSLGNKYIVVSKNLLVGVLISLFEFFYFFFSIILLNINFSFILYLIITPLPLMKLLFQG